MKRLNKKQRIRISIAGGIIALLVIVLVTFLSTRPSNKTKEAGYETLIVKKAEALVFKGTTKAENTQNYYLDASLGKITGISISDGQAITAGTVLFEYQNDDIKEQVDTQSDSLSKLDLAVQNAQQSLNSASSKQSDLVNQANQAISEYNQSSDEEQRATLEAKIDSLNASIEAQNEAVLQSKQALSVASLDLSSANESIERLKNKTNTNITSEVDGIAYINEKGKTDATTPLITVVSSATLVEGSVSEFDYERVKVDNKVTLKPTNGDKQITGKITRVDQLPTKAADSTTDSSGTANYKFLVKPDENLRYGYTVQISLPSDQIMLGKDSVIEENGEYFVYLYKSEKAKKQKITVQESNGSYIVLNGLNEKDKIIKNPDDKLKDGQEVAVN